MRVVSVNVGTPAPLPGTEGAVISGIVKTPVAGRVAVAPTNLAGDGQADLTVHGGPDKAVYAYPHEHYARWAAELSRDDLEPGRFFGENITTEGLDEDDVHIGDRFRVGTALLEVSQPRVPCYKLAIRMGDGAFARPFLASGRTGFYLRVVEEGDVAAGDAIEREAPRARARSASGPWPGLLSNGADPEALDRAAALPALALGWRESFANRAIALRRRAR